MQLMVFNPKFPGDKTRSVALSIEQFAVVHDFVVKCMNDGKRIKDQEIIVRLVNAGKPLVFKPVVCKHCKKELHGTNGQLEAVEPVSAEFPQYCWVDPEHGSQRHEAE